MGGFLGVGLNCSGGGSMEKFTVRYQDSFGHWADVFPGLTGDYAWALQVSTSTLLRDGQTITPEIMRIYKLGE